MSLNRKTSQLQIRVSPAQKDVLKRLAADAGMTVSQYVLATVLPSSQAEFARRIETLVDRTGRRTALRELDGYLLGLQPHEIHDALRAADLGALSPVLKNYVAAAVEGALGPRGVPVPSWVPSVAPLDEPHFAWDTASLRPHLMRLTPVTFKRRNLYVDALGLEGWEPPAPRAPEPPQVNEGLGAFADLDAQLREAGVLCELCSVGGAVIPLVFAREPSTRHVRALFRPVAELTRAEEMVAERRGLESRWITGAAARLLGPNPGAFVERGNLRVFSARPEYVFAMCCAAVRDPSEIGGEDDVRFLLRFMNLRPADSALSLLRRYLTDRQIPPAAVELLARLSS